MLRRDGGMTNLYATGHTFCGSIVLSTTGTEPNGLKAKIYYFMNLEKSIFTLVLSSIALFKKD